MRTRVGGARAGARQCRRARAQGGHAHLQHELARRQRPGCHKVSAQPRLLTHRQRVARVLWHAPRFSGVEEPLWKQRRNLFSRYEQRRNLQKNVFCFFDSRFSPASLANTRSAMTRSRGVRAGAVQAVRGAGDRRRARPGPHARE